MYYVASWHLWSNVWITTIASSYTLTDVVLPVRESRSINKIFLCHISLIITSPSFGVANLKFPFFRCYSFNKVVFQYTYVRSYSQKTIATFIAIPNTKYYCAKTSKSSYRCICNLKVDLIIMN